MLHAETDYDTHNGFITSLGKYEGEPWWTPQVFEELDPDDSFGHEGIGWYGLYVGVLPDYPAVILHERNDGFVVSELYDSADDARADFSAMQGDFNLDLEG